MLDNQRTFLTVMDNEEEILQALVIGITVASLLLHTYRYSKAIELFKECLVLLKEHSSKVKEEKRNKLYTLVYHGLFDLFCLVGDYENAIYNGDKAIPLYQQIGEFQSAAGLLEKIGDLYQFTGEQEKAKERFEKVFTLHSSELMVFNLCGMPNIKRIEHLNKMLVVTIKIGDKEREGWLLNQLGDLSLSLFEYAEAKEYFQRELAIWKETGNRKEEGTALCWLGKLYRKTEEYQQAKQHCEKAIAILEEAGEIKELGDACTELGRVCVILREFQKAKTLQKKALEISVKSEDKKGESIDYHNLADVHASLGEYDEAKKCYEKSLAISKEVDDRKGEALTYSDLGGFYRDRNDFEKAEDYRKKALEIYKEIGDLENEGSENDSLGDLYCFLGNCGEAKKCRERALAVTKQIGDKRGEGKAYCNLGIVYQSLGDYVKAKECHEQALAISIETNHLRGQGVDYGNLGTVCQHLGDYDKAYEYYKKALEMMLRTGHREGLPAAYNHLGFVCQHLGEYVKASKFYKKALATAKEIGDRRNEAKILSNLACLEQTIGAIDKATEYYKEALQVNKEVGDIRQEAVIYGNLGTVNYSLGDINMAKEYLRESLAITKKIGSKDAEGTVLGNLGCLHTSLGDYTEARNCYEQAFKISRETIDKSSEMTMNSNLGMLHLSQSESQKALECFKKALQICKQMGDVHGKSKSYCHIALVYLVRQDLPQVLSYLSASIQSLEEMRESVGESEHYKIGFADENTAPYRLMVTVLLKLGCNDMALTVSELARARSLADLMATQYSSQPLPSFDPNRWNDFANVIQKKSCTCLSFYFALERLLCWVLKADKKIMLKEVFTNTDYTTVSKNESVQSWIDRLASQGVRMFPDPLGDKCEDRSLVVLHGPVAGASEVSENLAACRLIEEDSDDESVQGREQSPLKVLHNILIAPVADVLVGSEIIIVPDRTLFKVPFAALMDESGKYLSETFIIRFAPSLTTLKLIQDSPADYHSDTGALIVGDPDVGTVRYQGRKVYISRLPFAKQEVEMIGQLLHARPLTGKQATKQTVLQEIHSVGLIHIAAHGDADRGDIALAPTNHEKDDFLLTMSDISKVQLRAKLVVLSCCHSGLGHIKAEGVVGIARAFLGSGARSVLVSLWAVDDSATMQFMEQFYANLVRGKSASQSLHETMKWMRGNPQFCEVRKWAPFMLIGDDVSFNFKK